METKRIVILMDCGTGTDTAEAWIIPADLSTNELDEFVWQAACQHAEMYGIYPLGAEDDYETDEDYNQAQWDSEDISGWWEPYDSKKHDGKLIYGSNDTFEWNEY